MGKRSNFIRVKNDNYRTFDPRACAPLGPLLQHYGVRTYAEPCCGLGDLIWQLKELGLTCLARYDINPRRPGIPFGDARTLSKVDLNGAGNIISNPPWLRPILHALIARFAAMVPTWLLFDSDWLHTKQSAPFMDYCTDVLSVGKLRFMPSTAQDGKDNCAWYRFDREATGKPTVFHGRVPQ